MRRARSSKKNYISKKKDSTIHARHEQSPSRAARVRSLEARKRPLQQRSRVMVDAILQAAAELFAGQGYARTTTNKIAERAGVSVGSLYQYFSNKDSLLAALCAEHRKEVHDIVETGLARLADPSVSLEQGLRQLLEELLAVHWRRPAVTRALSPDVIRESPAVAEQEMHDDSDGMIREIAALLETRADVRDGNRLAMAAVTGQTASQLTRWLVHDAPGGISQEALLEETVQLLARYLRSGPVRT
jgi:AcrR family transcriptional regulator